jgi:hypothetical protein
MKDKNREQTKVSKRIVSAIRQLAYPPEFLMGAPNTLEAEEIFGEERAVPTSATETKQHSIDESNSATPELLERLNFFADMGTALWRLRQKMVQPGTDQPLEEMRRAYRHFEAAWDLLGQTGVAIQDHTDQLFDSGMDLNVLTFQPMPNLKCEIVVETMRPTIYYKERVIQRGEVIVGTPENVA